MMNKILFITLSNIGDVILTLPVLDSLREKFPGSKITVLAGPRPKEIFQDNPYIDRLIIYDKHAKLKDKIKLFHELKKERFELVVDLRNSFFGAFFPARYKTSPFTIIPKKIRHMRDRHLCRLPKVVGGYGRLEEVARNKSLYLAPADEEYIQQICRENDIAKEDKIVVISPGARSHIKRWAKERFAELVSGLVKELGVKIFLVGDKDDIAIGQYLSKNSQDRVVDLCGKTSIAQLACLLKKARLLITNDSAVLHLGSYLDVTIAAIFGPTNERKYGPWSKVSVVVKKDIFCRPCEKAQCRFGTLACMQLIKVEDVLRCVRDVLNPKSEIRNPKHLPAGRQGIPNPKSQIPKQYRRILIVRTDRVGDVLLSTPVIKALRDAFANAYLSMMVSPLTRDIVEGNPYLDEVIIYDKAGKDKTWLASLKFSRNLKKKRFDLAIVLHPTNRVHLITFLAGIPRRVGYNRKCGFLLTDRIKHTKQLGQKHELEYNLDLVRYLGIEPQDKNLFMPIKLESERYVDELFTQEGINKFDKLLALHPAASCPSKVWPQERFAQAADKLIEKYGLRALIIAGPKDIAIAGVVAKKMHYPAVNLAGRLSLSQLASLLKRCQLFISNDSGPVHIACAVGTPVMSIFGRNQKGLSPTRWGPLGKKDRILHKEVGCLECLAHNCKKDFACLKAISVDDVLAVADSILGDTPKE